MTADFRNELGMSFIRIPPGGFIMGCPDDRDPERGTAKPAHEVIIPRPFFMQTTPVTQEQFQAIMGRNPSMFPGHPDRPVEHVSWLDARDFIRRLNLQGTGPMYRFPTEAEWEYAARAGSTGRYCFGDDPSRLDDHAWNAVNSEGRTHRVGQKMPNAWGLFDVHGLVNELVWDWLGSYPAETQLNPRGPLHGYNKVVRGGAYNQAPALMSLWNRGCVDSDHRFSSVGFRLAR